MKRVSLLMLCLFALASLSLAANDSLNVRTVGSWPYYSCLAIAAGHAGGHHVALMHCRGGVMTVNIDDSTAPKWMGEVAFSDSCNGVLKSLRDIFIQDTIAYVSLGSSGFAIVDFGDPANPILRSQVSTPGPILKLATYGNYIYAADDSLGLRVYDATDRSNPVQVNMIPSAKGCWGVARRDSFLFMSVAAPTSCYIISLNISNPANPVTLDSLLIGAPNARPYFVISGQYLYVWDFSPIVDISDPYDLVVRSNNIISGSNGKMAIADTILYTANQVGFSGYLFYNVANPDNVRLIKSYPTTYYARDLYLEGHTLYLADDRGMSIVDVSDPANPVKLGFFNAPTIYGKGVVAGGHGYFPADGLHVFDLTDSSAPRQISYCPSDPGGFSKIVLRDSFAFAAEALMGLRIFNVADPAHPVTIDSVKIPGFMGGLAVRDSFVYYAQDTLYVINVAKIDSPYIVSKFKNASSASDVTVAGNIAYVSGSAGLWLVDVSDPGNPHALGSCTTTAGDVVVRDTFAYVAGGNNGLRLANVANPANPFEAGSWSLGSGLYGASAVALDGKLAYVAYDTFGLRVVNISNPANIYEVGHYQIATNPGGDFSTLANGVSLWNGNAYVSYFSKGLQVFQYYGPNGVNGIATDELRIANSLNPNRPNPFTANTAISYQLSTVSNVTLIVYNVMGQQVRTLASGLQQAGPHDVRWNGRNDAGRQLSAGVYFCRLDANGKAITTKMVKIQ